MIAAKKIKVGLVGAGNIARHYSNLIKNREVLGGMIVGVADVNIEAASELASQHQCKSFANRDDLIDSTRPDLVLILTPSGFHYEHALAAMRRAATC